MYLKKLPNVISYFVTFSDFHNSVILYQFNRAKQLQFSCKLNQLLNNLVCKGLEYYTQYSSSSTRRPIPFCLQHRVDCNRVDFLS